LEADRISAQADASTPAPVSAAASSRALISNRHGPLWMKLRGIHDKLLSEDADGGSVLSSAVD